MYNLEKWKSCIYLLPQTGAMRVPGLIIASEKLMQEMDIEKPLQQVMNVATLPGIVGYSIAMPDIHWGYGFPIGGVAAMDVDEGVISPGGVGYDINCGVRLAVAPLSYKSLSPTQRENLLKKIFSNVPSGVGHGHKGKGLSDKEYDQLLEEGAQFSVKNGFGLESDLHHTESKGVIANASSRAISSTARERGRKQLGSIGSGNHFVELGEIQKIIHSEIAEAWGLQEGQLYILIHSGSRGFGHQVCEDNLQDFIKLGFAKNSVDTQLVAAPINSDAGKKYFAAMAAAANYAFNNRQQILHFVREAFFDVLNIKHEDIRLIYDVCHNIAKMEEHHFNGKKMKLCVHRKGATRAFSAGNAELAPIYQKTGQPVLVPGDMGRASYLLVGKGNPLTWMSCCHGAGRARSRIKSKQAWQGENAIAYMKNQEVIVMASSHRTIVEEMPDAYKNVEDVVEATQEADLADIVARLRPHLVVKG